MKMCSKFFKKYFTREYKHFRPEVQATLNCSVDLRNKNEKQCIIAE